MFSFPNQLTLICPKFMSTYTFSLFCQGAQSFQILPYAPGHVKQSQRRPGGDAVHLPWSLPSSGMIVGMKARSPSSEHLSTFAAVKGLEEEVTTVQMMWANIDEISDTCVLRMLAAYQESCVLCCQ